MKEGVDVLGQVVKDLALGLVSFSVSHANRFDLEIFGDFSIRKLACLECSAELTRLPR